MINLYEINLYLWSSLIFIMIYISSKLYKYFDMKCFINESYIYDNQTNIVKRIDKGLHCSVYNAINNEVSFTNII